MNDQCRGCRAPVSSAQMACQYCGLAQRAPASVDDELAMVREQAEVARQLGSAKRPALEVVSLSNQPTNEALQAAFWSTAFVPTTVPALMAALTACTVGAPTATADNSGRVSPLISALANRGEALTGALRSHRDATAVDLEAAASLMAILEARRKALVSADKQMWKMIGLGWVAIFGVGVLMFLLVSLTDTPAKRCRGGRRSGVEQIAACLEACGAGEQWACKMAETLKTKSGADQGDEGDEQGPAMKKGK